MLPLTLRAIARRKCQNGVLLARNPRTGNYHTSLPLCAKKGEGKLKTSSRRQTAVRSPRSPRIFPGSLRKTLEAHRDANREGLIRKVVVQPYEQHNGGDGKAAGHEEKRGRSRSHHVVGHGRIVEQDDPTRQGLGEGGSDQEAVYRGSRAIQIDTTEGAAHHPKGEWRTLGEDWHDDAVKPWMAHLGADWPNKIEYVYDYMTAEILAFERYMSTTTTEEAAAKQAFMQARAVIAAMIPEQNISLTGSRGMGLAMPFSDMDISVQFPSKHSNPSTKDPAGGRAKVPPASSSSSSPSSSRDGQAARTNTLDLLASIRRRLRKKGGPKPLFTQSTLVQAKVPIVRTTHRPTGLEIQVKLTTMTSQASTELVKSYMSEFPTLRPLFLVLRQALKMRDLGDARRHGIGSYPLLMMIVATLKLSGARFDRRDAARHLLYFFDFYTSIDFASTAISVDPPELFPRRAATATATTPGPVKARIRHSLAPGSSDQIVHDDDSAVDVSVGRKRINYLNPAHPYLMCLQDPANPYNDLGLQALTIKHVQATLNLLRIRTGESIDLFRGQRRPKQKPFSILDTCLRGDYRPFQHRRTALQQAGMNVKGPKLAK